MKFNLHFSMFFHFWQSRHKEEDFEMIPPCSDKSNIHPRIPYPIIIFTILKNSFYHPKLNTPPGYIVPARQCLACTGQ